MMNTRQQIRVETCLAELAKNEVRFMAAIATSKIVHDVDNWEAKSLCAEVKERINHVAIRA